MLPPILRSRVCGIATVSSFVLLMFTLHAWSQSVSVLHNFGVSSGDGAVPYSNVIMDSSGNLFGTTLSGGAHGLGAVYRLSPASGGRWKETIIYSFKGGPGDGASPHATLLQDG